MSVHFLICSLVYRKLLDVSLYLPARFAHAFGNGKGTQRGRLQSLRLLYL